MSLGLRLGLGFGGNSLLLSNPLPKIDNMINYTDFTDADAYTFSSGVTINTVAAVSGDKTVTGSGNFEYDATALNGLGGAVNQDASARMFYDTNFTADTTQTFGMVIKLPAYTADLWMFSYGGSSNAGILHDAVGLVRYYRDEANGLITMVNEGVDDITLLIVGRVNSAGSMDLWCNSLSGQNFNPRDAITLQNNISFGSRSGSPDGNPNTEYGEFFHCSDALTDDQVYSILRYWDRKYSTGFFFNLAISQRIVFLGDSLINTYLDDSTSKPITIKNNLEQYFNSAYGVDLAQGGLALFSSDGADAFVNSSTLEVTSTYTNFVANVHNPNNVELAIISLGTNGHAAIAANPDLALDCWGVLITQLQSDFSRLDKIINFVIGRQLGADNQDWQTVRDLNKSLYEYYDIVDQDGIEIYYLDYNAGDVHPDSNGETTFIPQLTNRILAEFGEIPRGGTIGMKISNAEQTDTNQVTITISHDGGTSLVVPTNGEDYYYIVLNGTAYQATAASVLNSTKIELTFGVTITGTFNFYYLYDEAFGTAATNTPYTQDENGLWLRSYSAQIVDASVNNVVSGSNNVVSGSNNVVTSI